MNQKQITDAFIVVFSLAIIAILFSPVLPWDKYNLYDYLKAKRLESYNEKHKEHFISCIYCKGSGQRVEDLNLLIYKAHMEMWLNKHLVVDKCSKCVRLPDGSGYKYCDDAEKQYRIINQEYAFAGPRMERMDCSKCMGMGRFSSFDLKEQRYLTQEEYEHRERNKQLTKENNNDNRNY